MFTIVNIAIETQIKSFALRGALSAILSHAATTTNDKLREEF